MFNSSEYKQHSSGFQIYNIWSLYAIRFRTVFAPSVSNIFLIVWNISSLFKFSMSVMEGISRVRIRTYRRKNKFYEKMVTAFKKRKRKNTILELLSPKKKNNVVYLLSHVNIITRKNGQAVAVQ